MPGAAGPQRMADGDRSAAGVHPFFVEAQELQHAQHLHGERLVELDALDLVERQPGPLQDLVDRRDRADAHLLGVDAGDGHRADPSPSA